jgi:putative ABC transport system substrate-binding protein
MTQYAAFLAATVLGTLAAATPPALARQLGKVFQIGILSPAGSPSTKAFDAFRNGLREFGYIEGSNIKIEYRLAHWDYGRLPAMAADLVRLPVDVIVTDAQKSARVAQEATHTIPIVAATAGGGRSCQEPWASGRQSHRLYRARQRSQR